MRRFLFLSTLLVASCRSSAPKSEPTSDHQQPSAAFAITAEESFFRGLVDLTHGSLPMAEIVIRQRNVTYGDPNSGLSHMDARFPDTADGRAAATRLVAAYTARYPGIGQDSGEGGVSRGRIFNGMGADGMLVVSLPTEPMAGSAYQMAIDYHEHLAPPGVKIVSRQIDEHDEHSRRLHTDFRFPADRQAEAEGFLAKYELDNPGVTSSTRAPVRERIFYWPAPNGDWVVGLPVGPTPASFVSKTLRQDAPRELKEAPAESTFPAVGRDDLEALSSLRALQRRTPAAVGWGPDQWQDTVVIADEKVDISHLPEPLMQRRTYRVASEEAAQETRRPRGTILTDAEVRDYGHLIGTDLIIASEEEVPNPEFAPVRLSQAQQARLDKFVRLVGPVRLKRPGYGLFVNGEHREAMDQLVQAMDSGANDLEVARRVRALATEFGEHQKEGKDAFVETMGHIQVTRQTASKGIRQQILHCVGRCGMVH